MRALLLLLCLFFVLAGCVTVQPCVCPTPAPKVEPASGFVYDGSGIPAQTLPWTTTTLEAVREPWYDIPTPPLVVATPTPTPTPTPPVSTKAKDGDCLWYDENGETEYGKGTAWKPCPNGTIWASCGVSTDRLLPGDTLDERGRLIPIVETRTVPCFGTPPAKSQRKTKR